MEVRRPGRECAHTAPCKNTYSFVSTPPYEFMTFRGATLLTFTFARIFITEHYKFKRLLDVRFGSAFPHVCYKKKLMLLPMQYRHTGEAEVLLHSFLTFTIVGSKWSTSRPSLFTPKGNNPCWPLKRRFVGFVRRRGRFEREKNVFILLGFKPRFVQPYVALLQYQLPYPNSSISKV